MKVLNILFKDRELGYKFFVLSIIPVIIIISVFFINMVVSHEQVMIQETKTKARSLQHLSVLTVSNEFVIYNKKLIDSVIDNLSRDQDVKYAMVIDASDNRILAHSDHNWDGATLDYYLANNPFRLDNPTRHFGKYNENKEGYELSSDIIISGKKYGVIQAFFSYNNVNRELSKRKNQIITIALFCIVFGAGLSIILSRVISNPIKKLAEQAKAIGDGEFGNQIIYNSKDILGQLAGAFNQMSLNLKATQKKLHEYKDHLEELVKERTSELRDSELKLTNLIETVPIGIAISSPEAKGSFTEINSTLCRIFGYSSKSDFLKMPALFHYYCSQKRESFFKLCEQGPVLNYETRFKRKDGSVFWGSISSVPQTIETGKIQFVNVFEDITDRKQAEEALQNSQATLSSFMKSATEGFVLHDKDLNLTDINPTALKIFPIETTLENLRGKNILEVMPGLKETGRYDKYKTVIETGEPVYFEDLVPDPILGNKHLSLRVFKVAGGLGIIFSDITERKAIEEKLQKSVEFSSNLLDSSPTPIIVINPDTSIKYVNNTLERFTGFSSEELIGTKTPYPFWRQDMINEIKNDIKEAMKKGAESLEEPFQDKNGNHLWVEITSISILHDGKLDYYLATWIDITDRKRKEEKIQASLKEKEVLLQEIHHRVKNNMQVISSLLRIQASYTKDERVTNALMDCQGRVQAMAFVHETLYASDRLSVIDFKAHIIRLANKMLRANKSGTGRIKLNVDAENISLRIEQATPLGLIVNELVSNSLKYAFPKNQHGEIFVSLRVVEQDTVEFIFSDNGTGIPDDIDWRNADSLGLQLIILLVEDQLDGTVNLNRDKGTRFTIKFRLKENK